MVDVSGIFLSQVLPVIHSSTSRSRVGDKRTLSAGSGANLHRTDLGQSTMNLFANLPPEKTLYATGDSATKENLTAKMMELAQGVFKASSTSFKGFNPENSFRFEVTTSEPLKLSPELINGTADYAAFNQTYDGVIAEKNSKAYMSTRFSPNDGCVRTLSIQNPINKVRLNAFIEGPSLDQLKTTSISLSDRNGNPISEIYSNMNTIQAQLPKSVSQVA